MRDQPVTKSPDYIVSLANSDMMLKVEIESVDLTTKLEELTVKAIKIYLERHVRPLRKVSRPAAHNVSAAEVSTSVDDGREGIGERNKRGVFAQITPGDLAFQSQFVAVCWLPLDSPTAAPRLLSVVGAATREINQLVALEILAKDSIGSLVAQFCSVAKTNDASIFGADAGGK